MTLEVTKDSIDPGIITRDAEPVAPPKTIREGVRIQMVADPDGNWVEFRQATA